MRDFDLESSLDQKDNSDLITQINGYDNESEIIKIIDEFFGITSAFERETMMANRIKRAFKRMRQRKSIRKFQKCVYKSIGYRVDIKELPSELIIFILSFLEKQDLYLISQLNNDFNEYAFDQSLWRSYQLKNQTKMFNISRVLPKILVKLENLLVLNFSFWAWIDEKAIGLLAPHINQGTLKELYLDGWEKVNDSALSVLTGRDPHFLQVETNFNRSEFIHERFPVILHKRKGLELLSISECRNIHWPGIMKLDRLQNLKTLNLLGWVSVKDEGINHLVKSNENLENLNLAGTSITSEWVYFIVREGSIHLKNVNIVGCK